MSDEVYSAVSNLMNLLKETKMLYSNLANLSGNQKKLVKINVDKRIMLQSMFLRKKIEKMIDDKDI